MCDVVRADSKVHKFFQDYAPQTDLLPLHIPGSLDVDTIKAALPDENDNDEEIISKLQRTVHSDGFMPMKAAQRKGKSLWVENSDCEKFMDIKADHGEEVANEVKRAWLEIQNNSQLVAGRRVPWEHCPSKKPSGVTSREPLSVAEIIMSLSHRLFTLAHHESKNSGENDDVCQRKNEIEDANETFGKDRAEKYEEMFRRTARQMNTFLEEDPDGPMDANGAKGENA